MSASVIVRNPAWFGPGERVAFETWLAETAGWPLQIIVTSPGPLFELVERGLFPADQYYRLNVVHMIIE